MTTTKSNNRNPLQSFQDYCRHFDIYHYADRETYKNINALWALIRKRIERLHLVFPNYETFIDYLTNTYNTVPNKYKFMYWTIIREFQRFQVNMDEFVQNYKPLMVRLKGYSHARECKNMDELKKECSHFLKRMRIGDNTDEDTRDFIIMARYICDYLEMTPDNSPAEIPVDLFG